MFPLCSRHVPFPYATLRTPSVGRRRMSQGYRQDYRKDPSQEPMVWERVEWRQGDGRYVFEVGRGGLHATLTGPQGRALTLPVVAWEGLLDALAAARKTRSRAERNLPARAGARWSE